MRVNHSWLRVWKGKRETVAGTHLPWAEPHSRLTWISGGSCIGLWQGSKVAPEEWLSLASSALPCPCQICDGLNVSAHLP